MPGILIATDADFVNDEVLAALSGSGTTIHRVRQGVEVRDAVAEHEPDLVVLDLQIGNMGGMAVCIDLHLEQGAGRLPHVPVLMLLDREPDIFLARRSHAEGWLVKPLDGFRLRRAAAALLAGGTSHEGLDESTAAVSVDAT
jgi:two-component system nitrate/nitrite response regulator NarL